MNSTIEVHGDHTTHSDPPITARVSTTFTGYSGTTPLYTVTITLNALTSPWFFGFDLWIYLNNQDKKIKPTSPPDESPYGRWGPNKYSVTFENVPYDTQPVIHSTNCGCGWWNIYGHVDYESHPYNPPGRITDLEVNDVTNAQVLNLDDPINLTWTAPSGGTGGILGYKVYFKTSGGYIHLATTSNTYYSTDIDYLDENTPRGTTYTFKVIPYNSEVDGQDSNLVTCKFANPTIVLETSNITANSCKVNWETNINIKKVEWKLSTDTNYKQVYSGAGTTSGNINITSLTPNKSYTINIRLTAVERDEVFERSTTARTLDIARIAACEAEWSVEDSTELTITNPANLALKLYLSYNNIELISRNNITLNNGKYVLTLSSSEKDILYTQTASDSNPSFKFILKSYSNSTKLGEDSKSTKITFPTKAWVKPNNTWKRALVWAKINNTWKLVSPWVKPGSTWKRV